MLKSLIYSISIFFATTAFSNEAPSVTQICSPTECYTVIEKVGEGAFGEVFAVEDSNGVKFAIKSLKVSHSDWGPFELLTDAEREFRIGQRLNHPNIVKSVDFFLESAPDSEYIGYLVLEYIPGKTVASHTKNTFENVESLEGALQLIQALSYALSFEMIHFDLHGGNVMLKNTSEVMVIDLASFLTYQELNKMFFRTLTEDESESSSSEIHPKLKFIRKQLKDFKASLEQHPDRLNRLYQLKGLSPDNQTVANEMVVFYQSYYFEQVTNMCVRIIEKSHLSRDEKILLRADIKRIAWEYSYDSEDKKQQPIEEYLNRLQKLIEGLI